MMNRNIILKTAALTLVTVTVIACGMLSSSPVSDVETQQPVPATTTPVESQILLTATLELVTLPVPTDTITPVPPPSAGNSQVDENRIKFVPGGTWAEVGAHLEEGDEIRYVLSAMKGQVMSVSVRQSWPFTVEVASTSGLLTDPGAEHPFWRGALPLTGDYTIIVKTYVTGDFSLRVAVNPPGESNQYFDFTDPQLPYTLRYSDEFTPTSYIPAGDFKGNPDLVLGFIRPDFYGPITNLSEAYFMVSAMDDPEMVATCVQPYSQLETITGHKTIKDYDFTRSEAVGVGAGNIYDQVIYRTVDNSICYEVVFYLHSGNIGNYPPGAVVEFNRAALLQKFEQILSTFSVH